MAKLITLVLLVFFSLQAQDVASILAEADKSWQGIKDFTASFYTKELVNGKILEQKNTILKFRKPLNVYMKWTEGDDEGQETIFFPEKYGHKLQAHGGGWLNVINVSLDPKGAQATKKARHTIYDSGIGHIVELVKHNYALIQKTGKGSIVYEKKEMFDGKNTLLFRAELPEGYGFYAKKIIVNFEEKTKLPVKITVYGFKNEFLESYAYSNLKFNTGLTDKDFDMDNPAYKF